MRVRACILGACALGIGVLKGTCVCLHVRPRLTLVLFFFSFLSFFLSTAELHHSQSRHAFTVMKLGAGSEPTWVRFILLQKPT